MIGNHRHSSSTYEHDPSDPVVRGYKLFFRKVRNAVFVSLAACVAIVIFGVPSIQGSYRYPSGIKSPPSATEKTEADYWNPATGWKPVRAGEYAPGCPMFVFMPLRDCVNLEPYKNSITTRIFGQEFFDGP